MTDAYIISSYQYLSVFLTFYFAFYHHRMAGKLERWLRVTYVCTVQGIVRQCLGPHGARAGSSYDDRLPVGHQGSGDGITRGHRIGKRIDGKSVISYKILICAVRIDITRNLWYRRT